MRPQPRGRRGTIGQPYSALNLRLAFAIFGLVSCALLAWLTARAGMWVLSVLLVVLAVVALVDIVVIQRRRAARRREERGARHSMFE
ncbi:MAG: hypothetical protein FWJ70_15585 [Micromonosporaceae bacterium]